MASAHNFTMFASRQLFFFVALLAGFFQCDAWTPQQQSRKIKPSLVAASAVFPFLPAFANAVDTSIPPDASGIMSSTMTAAAVDVFQIPLLAGYCAMALYFVPKGIKSMHEQHSYNENDYYDNSGYYDNSNDTY